MKKFKVGDRVRLLEKADSPLSVGGEGTVCAVEELEEPFVGVAFDEPFSEGHSCQHNCEYGRGWYVVPENLEHTKRYILEKFYEAVQSGR
jgi:hypothetical protein